MVKHLVMWRVKEEVTEEQKQEMKIRLEALEEKIPELLKIEVGIDIVRNAASADVSLYSEFADEQGLETYRTHPEHLQVVEFVKPLIAERRVVDYVA